MNNPLWPPDAANERLARAWFIASNSSARGDDVDKWARIWDTKDGGGQTEKDARLQATLNRLALFSRLLDGGSE